MTQFVYTAEHEIYYNVNTPVCSMSLDFRFRPNAVAPQRQSDFAARQPIGLEIPRYRFSSILNDWIRISLQIPLRYIANIRNLPTGGFVAVS